MNEKKGDICPVIKGDDFFCGRERCPFFSKSTFEQYEPSECTVTGTRSPKYCIAGYREYIAALEKDVFKLDAIEGELEDSEGRPFPGTEALVSRIREQIGRPK
jgi:hypothetical protein